MSNTRELRRRIKSTKNTSQITKAMQMVSAVKMKRAQDQALNGRPYGMNLSESLLRLLPKVEKESHPLLVGNDSKNTGVILLSTNKGLCGSLNTNLFRIIMNSNLNTGNAIYYTIGKKGRNFVVRVGKSLAADFENNDLITFRQAVQLSKLAIEGFKNNELGEIYLAYPHFVSIVKQEPRVVKLLPISISEEQNDKQNNEFLFEPNVDALLDALLIHHIETKIYQALLETKASEHSARMVAMKNATDSAKDLVEDLQLTYNQTRQAAITREILEISSAQAAME